MTEVPIQDVITAWIHIEDILRHMAQAVESTKGEQKSKPIWESAQYAHYLHKNLTVVSSYNKTVDKILLPHTYNP